MILMPNMLWKVFKCILETNKTYKVQLCTKSMLNFLFSTKIIYLCVNKQMKTSSSIHRCNEKWMIVPIWMIIRHYSDL
jgi:hypothetical protein